MTAPQPTSNYTEYRAAVAEAIVQSPQEWTFKSDPRYQRILEHVTPEQGAEFLALVEEEFPDLCHDVLFIEMVKVTIGLNDQYGSPVRAPSFNGRVECSPSNFRYLYHALRIWQHLEQLGLVDVHFVEVGGGYGGLALYLFALKGFFAPSLGTYTIIDLPEVAKLQAQYIRAHGWRGVRAVNGLDPAAIDHALWDTTKDTRYFVSCYAFSEFDAETRAWYEHRVARRCQHGFLLWNLSHSLAGRAEKSLGGALYPFVDAPLETEPERPTTSPGNLVVRF